MTAGPPPGKTPLEKRPFLYDKERGTFLGRTCKSWLLIFIFYVIYYFCLGCFWFALLTVFMETTIDQDRPRWMKEDGLIQNQPGLGVRPAQHYDDIASSLYTLKFDYNDGPGEEVKVGDKGNRGYAARLKEYLEKYESPGENAKDCDAGQKDEVVKNEDEWCHFKKDFLGECGDFPYGFGWEFGSDQEGRRIKTLSPCFLIKVNRIFNLTVPHIEQESEIPDDWPERIKKNIINGNFARKMYVDCQGEYPADREQLDEYSLLFFPRNREIDLKYFPVTTKLNNENAMIAIKIKNLPVGRMIQVTCKAYYKGVVHSKKEKRGFVNFQVFLEKEKEKEKES